jgi:hypothetical protein
VKKLQLKKQALHWLTCGRGKGFMMEKYKASNTRRAFPIKDNKIDKDNQLARGKQPHLSDSLPPSKVGLEREIQKYDPPLEFVVRHPLWSP